jgi:microcystin degradation protein MlrC
MNILIAGYQHETNTFAPSLADWAAFNRGDSFPAFVRGQAMLDKLSGINIPVAGFMEAARREGWRLVPSAWAGAIPSSFVTRDAFERISAAICEDLHSALKTGLDAVYLDLHGAAVAEHAEDSEGELLARVRALVGPHIPIVASLDLHANVSPRMLQTADALVAYRTYPHIDMADTGALAAHMLKRRVALGRKEAVHWRKLDFLIPLSTQSTWLEPAKSIYNDLLALDAQHHAMLSFCPGFPAADFEHCGPTVWGYGDKALEAVEALYARVSEPTQWRPDYLPADQAVARAIELAANTDTTIVIADTQDNPGAGGDSNTTGVLHELLRQGAGQKFPGRVALGLLCDPAAAQAAHRAWHESNRQVAGVNTAQFATISIAIGKAVPTFTGCLSDPPVPGPFTVRAVSDGVCTLKGAVMTGATLHLGQSAALEQGGVLIAVTSGKKQMLDRELFRMVGIEPEHMKIVVVKSSNHFRADFTPLTAQASHTIIAKAAGPMALDPADLPWKKLPPTMRRTP